MKLNYQGIQDKAAFAKGNIRLPGYDWKQMAQKTVAAPTWIHFGAGNIFRGFIARLADTLLEKGLCETGIIAAETFDYDIIEKIYDPYDNMTLNVRLHADGGIEKEVISSIAKGLRAGTAFPEDMAALRAAFRAPSLQMISFTITEKGYALTNMEGKFFPFVEADFTGGPEHCSHAMSVVAALLLERYRAGAYPIAVVSMDNCSHNGERLRGSVLTVAAKWVKNGFADSDYLTWLSNEEKVSFPWSMIDKITPRPSSVVEQALEAAGLEEMAPITTGKNTYIAPFVNAEVPQYLVVEDRFPGGHPPLEKAGVYLTDRETVSDTERMKVTTCLNPLHTALAVYGCLLSYESISAEMKDHELKALVERIGYDEGMPVVVDPKILSPKEFIREVLEERLPNPFIPDTPQRIATDTSQKIPVRYGETIKSYVARADLDPKTLTFIPLAIAGWLRYLLGVDDKGMPMEVSGDPMLGALQSALSGVTLGNPQSARGKLSSILSNEALFGCNLVTVGLAQKVEDMLCAMLQGPGAVRSTLVKYLSNS